MCLKCAYMAYIFIAASCREQGFGFQIQRLRGERCHSTPLVPPSRSLLLRINCSPHGAMDEPTWTPTSRTPSSTVNSLWGTHTADSTSTNGPLVNRFRWSIRDSEEHLHQMASRRGRSMVRATHLGWVATGKVERQMTDSLYFRPMTATMTRIRTLALEGGQNLSSQRCSRWFHDSARIIRSRNPMCVFLLVLSRTRPFTLFNYPLFCIARPNYSERLVR